MQLEQLNWENLELLSTKNFGNTKEIINQLIDQHTFVSDKLLPEIDMHFWALMRNNSKVENQTIQEIYQIFSTYKEQLEDHFYFEEVLVFPAILKNQILDETSASFVQKHDDFEVLLGKMISEIQEKLSPIRELMSLRVLELKLERLVQIMEEHQVLEDYLFAFG